MPENCTICFKESTAYCSNCKKVVYCGKEHQKQDRKRHKPDCFPAAIKSHPILGYHLQATRDILPGEKIFKEKPLIVGPRSNLSQFHKICLGCCDKIEEKSSSCSKCGWPVCGSRCEQNPRHACYECPILTNANVPPAECQNEYLCITFLRCILLKDIDPGRWEQLMMFESHVEQRKSRPNYVEQSNFAVEFIRNKCQMTKVESKAIDFVYGVVIVNGFADHSTFAVKLYPRSSKLSHDCIPNTKTILDAKGLEIVTTLLISTGQPLTQLYGRISKGTFRRQELLQNVYFFTCRCSRCLDPTELGTNFSAIKCSMNKCAGYLLPNDPLDITPISKWNCNQSNCSNCTTFLECVIPALAEIEKQAGTQENDGLYSQYEVYQQLENSEIVLLENIETTTSYKLQHILKMQKILENLETFTVHKNHYALLPLKSALIASMHSLLSLSETNKKEISQLLMKNITLLLENYLERVKEVLEVMNVLFPGLTSERGIILFYLSEGMRFSLSIGKVKGTILLDLSAQMDAIQQEALQIMLLENEDDDHRKTVLKYCKKC